MYNGQVFLLGGASSGVGPGAARGGASRAPPGHEPRSGVIHDYGERVLDGAPDEVLDWLKDSAGSAGWTLVAVDPYGQGQHLTWVDVGDRSSRKAQLVAVVTPLDRGGCRVHMRER